MVSTTLKAADVDALTQPPEGADNKTYAELKKLVKEANLLTPRWWYSTFILIEPFVLMGAGVTILILFSDIFWLQLLNAFLMSLAYIRAGFVMHDTGHRQLFLNKPRLNDRVGMIYANLLLGSSISSWRARHNEHHAFTNELGKDPTLEIPVWAWIEEQISENKSGLIRFLMKWQAITFFPVLSLSAFFQAFSAIRDVLFTARVQDRFFQGIFLLAHHTLYFILIFNVLNWWQAIIFFFVHHLVLGIHLGLVFAPNHKGMPIVNPDHKLEFFYVQALTTRNVVPGLLNDYFYGGLNYQLEHHFYPNMPRCNLGKAREITKTFCEAHNVPYHETGVLESYREILSYMHQIGANLRGKR